MGIGNLIFLLLVLISFVGIYKIFEKIGKPAWKGLVPFYNYYELFKSLEKPWWWMFLMIVPGVNMIMYGVIGYHTAHYFGKRKSKDLLIACLMPYLYIVYLGFSKDEKWVGVADLKNKKGGLVKNWIDPLLFAVVAATVIRTFFLEAFTIPTSSLEKSLLVGDFLFVNKFAYGPKIPQTPLAFPFAHHTLPFTTSTKSYVEWIKLPYMRIPGYSKVKNGDIVVFNYPDGDTVALNYQSKMSYYQILRDNNYSTLYNNPTALIRGRDETTGQPITEEVGPVAYRPIDKREHYVKRCVAIAGDKFEVREGDVYINDVKQKMPENAQHFYNVKFIGQQIDQQWLDKMDINLDEAYPIDQLQGGYDSLTKAAAPDTFVYMLNLTEAKVQALKNAPYIGGLKIRNTPKGVYEPAIFPHNPRYKWNNDNFGPYVIPKEGATVNIDTTNICLYDRVIKVYDNNSLEVKGGKIFINGVESKTYTFKQDYYFMMGDNRHNSADSRCWGLVPFDHVVGKPVFVWFSMKDPEKNPVSGKGLISSLFKNSKDGKYRWERFMCFVGDNGLSKSYFIHFLVIIGLWWGGSKFYRRYKSKKAPVKK